MLFKKHLKYMYYLSFLMVFMLCTIAVRKYSTLCFLEVSSLNEHCRQEYYASLELPPEDPIDCPRIIRGDMKAIDQALIDRVLVKKRQAPITEEQYLRMTKDCKMYKKIRKFITFPLSKKEEDFPIAYSMVVHDKIDMFERLLRAIYAPQNIYCVHVDDKSPDIFKEAVRAITNCFDNVFAASKLEKVVYASWSRVQADLNCMEDLLNSKVKWKYLLNTCGVDFPLKTNAEIVKALQLLQGKNSMESEKTPEGKIARWTYHFEVDSDIHETDTKKSPPPDNVKMFSGNAYIVITRDFVKSLFDNPQVKKIIEWEKDTYSPDEHLWATLNRMPGVPGSVPSHKKYDTSDLLAIARLVKWQDHVGNVNEGAPYSQCTGTYQRGICIYGVGDLPWIVQQHHLFANKFDSLVDNNAIQCLEQYLRQKALYGEEP